MPNGAASPYNFHLCVNLGGIGGFNMEVPQILITALLPCMRVYVCAASRCATTSMPFLLFERCNIRMPVVQL